MVATATAKPARSKAPQRSRPAPATARASLTLSSKNYSSWSLRGWLLARFAGLEFDEVMVSPDDVDARRELLLLAPSILVPCLTHEGTRSWNVMAIAYYLDEAFPAAGLLPAERAARAHCRSICGEMNSGFANLRSALPMNLKVRHKSFKIWAGAHARHRAHRRRSGATAWPATAGRTCSAHAARWPTRCSRRW